MLNKSRAQTGVTGFCHNCRMERIEHWPQYWLVLNPSNAVMIENLTMNSDKNKKQINFSLR